MCLLKKFISPPDHRVNKNPCTPPLDNLLQRGYLEGIGWSPMAMLLGPENGSIMVRHVLYVHEGALPSNILFLRWVYFLLLSTNIVKIKCFVHCKWCKQDDCSTFFPVVIFSGHSWCSYFDTYSNTARWLYLFFPVVIFSGDIHNPTTVLYTKYVRKVNNYFPPGPKN